MDAEAGHYRQNAKPQEQVAGTSQADAQTHPQIQEHHMQIRNSLADA